MNDPIRVLPFSSDKVELIAGRKLMTYMLEKWANTESGLRIITYSLPSLNYLQQLLRPTTGSAVLPRRFKIIADDRAKERIRKPQIENAFPGIQIKLRDNVHSKVVLIDPDIVIVGSTNFVRPNFHETSVFIRSTNAYKRYVQKVWEELWKDPRPVSKPKERNGFFK